MATTQDRIFQFDELSRDIDWYFRNPDEKKKKMNLKWKAPKDAKSSPVLWRYTTGRDDIREVRSGDPAYIAFRKELMEVLDEKYPAETDEDGFVLGKPMTGDFSALSATTGIPMHPLNIPLADNTPLLEHLGLETKGFQTLHHQKIADALFDLMFGTYVPNSYHIQKKSSSTFPMFKMGEDSKVYKKGMFYRILTNVERILSMVVEGKWDELANDYHFIMVYNLATRHQPDKGGKVRKVYDSFSQEVPADKKSWFDEQGLEWGEAMRVRTVYGLAASVNYLLSMFVVCRRKHYFEEYAFTWHHTGPVPLFNDLQKAGSIIGADVTQMDQTVPAWFLEHYAKRCEDIYDARLAKVISFVNKAPYYANGVNKDLENFFVGDPANPETWDINVGLASGRAENPDLGKYWMTFVYSVLLDSVKPIIRPKGEKGSYHAFLHRFLKGFDPSWLLKDMGDDAVVGVTTAAGKVVKDNLRTVLDSGKASPYAVIDIEIGTLFVGNVLMRDGVGNLLIPRPSMKSYVVNRLCPERGIDNGMRKDFWATGFLAAHKHFSAIGPEITEITAIIKAIWNKHIHWCPDPYICATHMSKYEKLPPIPTLNAADREVMMDPAKMFYRFDPTKDLSSDVVDFFTWTVPAEDIDNGIRSFNRNIDYNLNIEAA